MFAVWCLLRGEIGRGLISSRCQHFSTPPPPNSAHCTEKNTHNIERSFVRIEIVEVCDRWGSKKILDGVILSEEGNLMVLDSGKVSKEMQR